MLTAIQNVEISAEAETGIDTILKVKEHNPDIVILDYSMPVLTGIEAAGIIKKENPETALILLLDTQNEQDIFDAFNNGISGIISKNTSKEELLKVLRSVCKGNRYISDTLSDTIIRKLEQSSDHEINKLVSISLLTKREKEILKFVAEGYSNSEIAKKLSISPRTVDSHKTHLIKKLNLTNNAALRKFALEKTVDIN